jgi:hypothetical protein
MRPLPVLLLIAASAVCATAAGCGSDRGARPPTARERAAEPLNASGQQVSETTEIVLVQAAGEWIALLDGTDLASVCLHPAPQPVVDLLCH